MFSAVVSIVGSCIGFVRPGSVTLVSVHFVEPALKLPNVETKSGISIASLTLRSVPIDSSRDAESQDNANVRVLEVREYDKRRDQRSLEREARQEHHAEMLLPGRFLCGSIPSR